MVARPDEWSRWVLERRDGSDEHQRDVASKHLAAIRDRVLANAEPLEGMTLLDVGAGDGLIALAALNRVGPDGTVIFSDVSPTLLDHCRGAVGARGLLDCAQFVLTRAEDLAELPDASVDVATTRSVLIYVADKAQAFAALHRVLRPGGRVSLFEPINRLTFPEPPDRFWGYDVSSVSGLADKVKAAFDELEDPRTAAMIDFDDRDLARLAEDAGFARVHLERHMDTEPGSLMHSVNLDALLDTAPNPLAPTPRQAIARALTKPERTRFLAHLSDAVVSGDAIRRSAVAYLVAHKDS